jgi:RimK-like ATP-grasp domain
VQRIGVLYEHPRWFTPLFAEFDRRGIPYGRLYASTLTFDPDERTSPYAMLVNRMSPSAWTRGHGRAIFQTLHYLAHLEDVGAKVLNGHRAFSFEISKARQLGLFARLGLRHPRARVINHPSQAPGAAEGLRFPVMVKPNVGGSGAGIRVFDRPDDLARAAAERDLEMGPDLTALVQEYLPAAESAVVRIEVLGGEFLYGIRLRLVPGTFNLCPADYCDLPGVADGAWGRESLIERYQPPRGVIEDARRIAAAVGIDVGGVEYLVSARDGLPYFYDINALSNFVADAPSVVGFDPFVNLVDLILERTGMDVRTGSLG